MGILAGVGMAMETVIGRIGISIRNGVLVA